MRRIDKEHKKAMEITKKLVAKAKETKSSEDITNACNALLNSTSPKWIRWEKNIK